MTARESITELQDILAPIKMQGLWPLKSGTMTQNQCLSNMGGGRALGMSSLAKQLSNLI